MRRTGTSDYLRGALWLMPLGAVVLALLIGGLLSNITVGAGSSFDRLLFQGTGDDARTLLIGISGTMMTVIALVLGLTLVALQLASTQFSPRLLRYFLRDRVNQMVLSVFVATFVYSTAGLYTVGVASGERTDDYPRLAVTFALVLLFASLIVLVYFVHHISHSIQVDEIMVGVERTTMRIIEHDLPTTGIRNDALPPRRSWAVAVPSYASGYVQVMHPERLVERAVEHDLVCAVVPMIGEHLIEGEPIARLWRTSTDDPAPDVGLFAASVREAVRIGTSAPTSRTSRSASASWLTSRPRRCRRRSTTPTPRCRRPIISRWCWPRSRSARSATRCSPMAEDGLASSCRAATSRRTSSSPPGRYAATAAANPACSPRCSGR